MKNLFLAILLITNVWGVFNYGIAVGELEEYSRALAEAPREIIRQVAVTEVPIPPVYSVKELDDYSFGDWWPRNSAKLCGGVK